MTQAKPPSDLAGFDLRPVTEKDRRQIAAAKKRGRFVTTAALRARLARRRRKKR